MLQQGLAYKGFAVEASDGKIGTVSDFLFDDQTWKLRWLVIDTGNWLRDRRVLIHPSSIDKADIPIRTLLVKLTRDQVEQSPAIATDEPVSMQMEYGLYGYYGVDPIWGGSAYGTEGGSVPNTTAALPAEHGRANPHLRSLVEVTGYTIEATDGDMGHVESFLIDDASWDIHYLVADTRNWWFGRHVLLSPAAVTSIIWDEHKLTLNLTGYKIKGSPAYDATSLLDRAYEQLLQAYYDWPTRLLPVKHPAAEPAPPAVAAE